MSIADDKVVTMNQDDLLEKSQELSDFFLPVFEDYWMKGGQTFDGDIVEFCLYTHNLSFQIAFLYAHKMIKPDGLTEKAVADIEEVYLLMNRGLRNGQD